MTGVVVPDGLRFEAQPGRPTGYRDWLAALPDLVSELAERWNLRLQPPFLPGGTSAWVAPGRDAAGADRVLKIGWRHQEAEHEAAGLRCWAGVGAVRLHDTWSDETTTAMVLERVRPGTELRTRPEPEQDPVVAGLLRRLHVRPPIDHRFRPLQAMCDAWADSFEARLDRHLDLDLALDLDRGRKLDRGLLREGVGLLRSLPGSAGESVLLVTDLHAGNVLAAEREPWLAIDPKPYVGDRAYDVQQHLLNCTRLATDPIGLARRLADLLDLAPDRVLSWLFARCTLLSLDPGPWGYDPYDVAVRIAATDVGIR